MEYDELQRRSTFLNMTSMNLADSEAPRAQATQGVRAPRQVQQPLVAAIDGGGTKTLFLLATADGTVICVGRGGPLNALFVSPNEAIRSVRQAAAGALSEAGMKCADVAVSMRALPGFVRYRKRRNRRAGCPG